MGRIIPYIMENNPFMFETMVICPIIGIRIIGREIPLDHPMNALMTIPQDWYTIGTRFNLTTTINMILDDFSVS